MYEYRVTKYDPSARDSMGRFIRDEWTCASDVGRMFGGVALTRDEYLRVERTYVDAALEFLHAARVPALAVVELEDHNGSAPISDGDVLDTSLLADLIPHLLRAEYWCRLESENAFIHFGHDYYMYIGVSVPCPEAITTVTRSGLFVEEFDSPYKGYRT